MAEGDTVAGGDAAAKGTGAGVGAGAGNGRTRCVRSLEVDNELPFKGEAVTQENKKVYSSKTTCQDV